MRYEVASYEAETDTWLVQGSVILPHGAGEYHVENALAALKLYCPRGADELEWGERHATIYDATGFPMVRLIARVPERARRSK